METPIQPSPQYILVALNSTSQPPSSNNLKHPTIQYHYTDDSVLSLLPQHPDEHVFVLNQGQSAQSISQEFTVTGLKIEEAPGAAAANQDKGDVRDDRMYIIETACDECPTTPPHDERKSAGALLAQFKARNGMIRHALTYPSLPGDETTAAPPRRADTFPLSSSVYGG